MRINDPNSIVFIDGIKDVSGNVTENLASIKYVSNIVDSTKNNIISNYIGFSNTNIPTSTVIQEITALNNKITEEGLSALIKEAVISSVVIKGGDGIHVNSDLASDAAEISIRLNLNDETSRYLILSEDQDTTKSLTVRNISSDIAAASGTITGYIGSGYLSGNAISNKFSGIDGKLIGIGGTVSGYVNSKIHDNLDNAINAGSGLMIVNTGNEEAPRAISIHIDQSDAETKKYLRLNGEDVPATIQLNGIDAAINVAKSEVLTGRVAPIENRLNGTGNTVSGYVNSKIHDNLDNAINAGSGLMIVNTGNEEAPRAISIHIDQSDAETKKYLRLNGEDVPATIQLNGIDASIAKAKSEILTGTLTYMVSGYTDIESTTVIGDSSLRHIAVTQNGKQMKASDTAIGGNTIPTDSSGNWASTPQDNDLLVENITKVLATEQAVVNYVSNQISNVIAIQPFQFSTNQMSPSGALYQRNVILDDGTIETVDFQKFSMEISGYVFELTSLDNNETMVSEMQHLANGNTIIFVDLPWSSSANNTIIRWKLENNVRVPEIGKHSFSAAAFVKKGGGKIDIKPTINYDTNN